MIPTRILFVLAVCLALMACESPYYEAERELEGDVWPRSNVVAFDFEIEDTLQIYNIFLEIDHSVSYDYENIYCKIHTYFPSGDSVSQLLSFELANDVGEWIGKCGGQTCERELLIRPRGYFNQIGVHRIALEQFMRDTTVAGIGALKLRIEEMNARRDDPPSKENG